MNIPENLRYTKEHEFVKVVGNTGIVGITDYAQGELGDIIYLDITAEIGSEVKQGDTLGSIEAVKTVSEVYSPISGKLADINSAINDTPSVINEDPYGKGWLLKIEISDMNEISNLLDSAAYRELTGA
ncbi:glycine cleavage system protein GcvH [bacterium]|nr:MAG: glycine cleavage system protein GcvH [bacterium]